MEVKDMQTLADCKRALGGEILTSAQALERALYCEQRSMEVSTSQAKTFFIRRMALYEQYALILEKAGR